MHKNLFLPETAIILSTYLVFSHTYGHAVALAGFNLIYPASSLGPTLSLFACEVSCLSQAPYK